MKPPKNQKNQGSARSSKTFSHEDVVLWKKVADTTTPLTKKRGALLQDEMQKLMNASSPHNAVPTAVAKSGSQNAETRQPNLAPETNLTAPSFGQGQLNSNPIEKTTLRKLGRGTKTVDARIDLHGMTQDRARFALLDFLQMSQRSGHRIVLVITGKGNEGRGVLRQNVPRWLGLAGFAQLVNGYETAHGHHGGDGALYVRLRRLNRETVS